MLSKEQYKEQLADAKTQKDRDDLWLEYLKSHVSEYAIPLIRDRWYRLMKDWVQGRETYFETSQSEEDYLTGQVDYAVSFCQDLLDWGVAENKPTRNLLEGFINQGRQREVLSCPDKAQADEALLCDAGKPITEQFLNAYIKTYVKNEYKQLALDTLNDL